MGTSGNPQEFVISSNNTEAERLDKFLSIKFPDLSRSYLKKLIEEGNVKVSGNIVKPSFIISKNTAISLSIPDLSEFEPRPQNVPLNILYEDKDLIVINKPAGMPVHPQTPYQKGTLVNALLFYTRELSSMNTRLRPGIVHRLDENTSGVIIVAKTDIAYQKIAKQFHERLVEKKYIAIVEGYPAYDEGTIEVSLKRHHLHPDRMEVSFHDGKDAITRYKVAQRFQRLKGSRFQRLALLELKPSTGRTHQIRVHLSYYKLPVLCDKVYGKSELLFASDLIGKTKEKDEAPILSRQALHAKVIKFRHPTSGKIVRFEAPLPKDIENVLGILRSK